MCMTKIKTKTYGFKTKSKIQTQGLGFKSQTKTTTLKTESKTSWDQDSSFENHSPELANY